MATGASFDHHIIFTAVAKSLPMESLKADFSEKYNRRKCPIVDQTLDESWRVALERNPRIFNGSKFRFHDVSMTEQDSTVLQIGMTDYKETMCTNLLENKNDISRYGEKYFLNKHACFADPVGVTAVVVTKDDFVIAIKRSHWVGESKGKMDTPGGHAEPDEMLKKLGMCDSDIFQVDSSDIIHEIFHSMVREVRDEINVLEESLSWPQLLGIMRNAQSGCKPCFLFLIRCKWNSTEVRTSYNDGGLETDESTELHFISSKELVKYSESDFLKMKDGWSPCGLSMLILYCHYLREVGNLKEA